MAAEIHQLPRFTGERPRALPSGEIPFHDALALLGTRADEWRRLVDNILQTGDYLVNDEGRDHVIADAAALQALGEDLQSMAKHLRHMSELLKPDE